jgi:uncharacterized membrane protein
MAIQSIASCCWIVALKLPVHFNWRLELHPILVHFAVALLCFAFFLDAIAWLFKSPSARSAAFYALLAGTFATVLSVMSGLVTPEAREHERPGANFRLDAFTLIRFFSGRLVEVHKHWGFVLLALVVLWSVLRVVAQFRPHRWQGVAMGISVLALLALVITGYYGGDLVYGGR